MQGTTGQNPRVAIAAGETREEAVGRALNLVREDIVETVEGRVVVKPNLLSSTDTLASTQPGAVRPVLELLADIHACGGSSIADSTVIAEGGTRNTRDAYRNFGYEELARVFGVELIDLNTGKFNHTFEAVTQTGDTHVIPYADLIAEADTIVSVALAKTHDFAAVTLSLKNMMGCLRRICRPRMHGLQIGRTYETLGNALWQRLDNHPLGMNLLMGMVFGGVHMSRYFAGKRHHGENPGLLSQVRAMAENLVRLGRVLMPDVAVIDAFEAMEGQGPGKGQSVPMGIAVAGTDPIACDAVMAYMMGFEPLSIGYLALAHEQRLGVAVLDRIDIIGEDPGIHRRLFVRHTNNDYHMRWNEAWQTTEHR